MRRCSKFKVTLYCVMAFLFWFSNYAFMSFLSAHGYMLTDTAALVGIMLGAYGWTQAAFRIPIGILADRWDNRRIFVQMGCCMCLIAALGLYFSKNIYWMILCRALSGISACAWAPMTILFTSYFDPKQSSKPLSLINACYFGGSLLSSVLAIPTVAVWGMRATFLLAAAAAIPSIIISFFITEAPSVRKPIVLGALLSVGKTKWVLSLSMMSIIVQIMSFAASFGFTPQLALRLGQKQSDIAMVQLVSMATALIFTLLTPRLFIKNFGARNSLLFMIFVQAAATFIQPIMNSVPALYTVVAIEGLSRGVNVSLFLCLIVMPFTYVKQSAAMGFYQGIYSIGIILGPTITGFVAEATDLQTAFYVIGTLGLIAPMIGFFCLSDERRKLPVYE